MSKQFKSRKTCGMLYAGGREYILLHPYPVSADSWQRDTDTRFFVVPNDRKFLLSDDRKLIPYYPNPRHIIVRGDWIIDYDGLNQDIQVEIVNWEGDYDHTDEMEDI